MHGFKNLIGKKTGKMSGSRTIGRTGGRIDDIITSFKIIYINKIIN